MILGGVAAFAIFAGAVHASDDAAVQFAGTPICRRDRICRTSETAGTAYTDADQDGICDNRTVTESRSAVCLGDTDNDGVCDRPACGNGMGCGSGRRHGGNR